VTGMNGIVPKQSSAITQNNIALTPLSSNSPQITNQLSFPTNPNSSASSESSSSHHHRIYGEDHGKSNKHHGGYCSYSDYKSNVKGCG
jgi:hypothetical protein